jgi:hypothetical protein
VAAVKTEHARTEPEILAALRELRARVGQLRSTLIDDLAAFIRSDQLSFRRLPASNNTKKEASVATTCSVIMALSLGGKLSKVYETQSIKSAIDLLMSSAWDSSELPVDNAFTRTILLRTIGMLVEHGAVTLEEALALRKQDLSQKERAERTVASLKADPELVEFASQIAPLVEKLPAVRTEVALKDIFDQLAATAPASLRVLQYLPTPTLGYWFMFGVDKVGFTLSDQQWRDIARWSRDEVAKQIGLITAKDDARMDPIAMAMAACLASRIRRLVVAGKAGAPSKLLDDLPKEEELRTAVRLLFQKQGESGIWPKYFPLFHYPHEGTNYCFSFELLEAVLHEIVDTKFLVEDQILRGFQMAVAWCETNRLRYPHNGRIYEGWNSGGEIKTLEQGIPESWATAVVHMFACELETALNRAINDRVLKKYNATSPAKPDKEPLEQFIDIKVLSETIDSSVKTLLLDELVLPAESASAQRLFRLKGRWSALLFGPPGTSKTSLVKGVAAYLGWPYVEINPSDFLKGGLEKIPIQADEVFADLMDLSKAVVLFDEMDAIVKRREKKEAGEEWKLDPTSELLTTSMLPKLAHLHERAQTIFFFATNHVRDLDSAITRPGRFDMWLCMGPPKWDQKLAMLGVILKRFGIDKKVVENSQKLLRDWTQGEKGSKAAKQLDLFTFAEIQSFLEYLCRKRKKPMAELVIALTETDGEGLRGEVAEWHERSIILNENSPTTTEYNDDQKRSKLQ